MSDSIFDVLTGEGIAADDLSGKARAVEPRNFTRHVLSLSATKTADGLLDPKLVLSWLLETLGSASFLVGLLVPVREAGALLPQLLTAPRIHAMARRKWAWAGGSLVQGLCAAGIVVMALTMGGTAAGVAIVGLLAILAVARSVCSVSYKDILGKTVGKTRRGSATGAASTVASLAVLVFALILMTGKIERFGLVVGALTLAAALWLIGAVVFSSLEEEPTPSEIGGDLSAILGQMRYLADDARLRDFIAARGCLVGTALAPPFLVLMAAEAGEGAYQRLGALVLASSVAAFLSSYVWGRLADRSSRRVLIFSGVSGALSLGLGTFAGLAGLMSTPWMPPLVLFLLMISYHGVRQGRSVYLVDMAPEDLRAAYTAVSNTVIGIVLLLAGLLGAAVSSLGAVWAVALFAALSLAGAVFAMRLPEVEDYA